MRSPVLVLMLVPLVACNGATESSATDTDTDTDTASESALTVSKGCPTYDLGGTWSAGYGQFPFTVTGTFNKSDCTISLSYCETTLTFSGAADPTFQQWAAINVVVQADGSVPPACLQPGSYSCTTVTAYDSKGNRLWSLDCGTPKAFVKQ